MTTKDTTGKDTTTTGKDTTGKPKTPADAAKDSAARRDAAKAKAQEAKRNTSNATQNPGTAKPKAAPPKTRTAAPRQVAAKPDIKAAEPFERQGSGWIERELRTTLDEGKKDVAGVRRRLRITYAVIVVFAVALFVLGIALVGFPARAFYRGDIDELTFGALAAAGAVLLALLLYFRPLDRLQALVADSTYVALVKDSFQYQVALRLIALDTDDSDSVEHAAMFVGEAAQASMDLVYTQMQARRAAGFSGSAGS